jgi:hypothetical protein
MVWDFAACTPTSGSGCAVPDVWTVDADGSGQRKVLDGAFQPRWSPDGSKLLFQRYDANPDLATLGVYLAQSDGTGVRELVRAALWGSPGVPPAWSPTGRTILYGETLGASVHVTRLSTVTADGRHRRTLTSGVAPAWAPDGSRIAFTRTSGIWVIPSRGSRPRRIAAASVRDGLPFPAWSPAGKQLAYNSGNQLYVARIDGRSTKLVTQGAHRYVRRLLPSLTAGLVSQRPAPVLLELRSPSGAFLNRQRGKGRGLRPAPLRCQPGRADAISTPERRQLTRSAFRLFCPVSGRSPCSHEDLRFFPFSPGFAHFPATAALQAGGHRFDPGTLHLTICSGFPPPPKARGGGGRPVLTAVLTDPRGRERTRPERPLAAPAPRA